MFGMHAVIRDFQRLVQTGGGFEYPQTGAGLFIFTSWCSGSDARLVILQGEVSIGGLELRNSVSIVRNYSSSVKM